MNYCDLFTPDHIAMLHDWLAEKKTLSVHIYWPHRGCSGSSYLVTSLQELRQLLSAESHPEIEIYILRQAQLPDDDEVDRCYDHQWVYKNQNDVLYITVAKNLNYYERYHTDPKKYDGIVSQWFEATA
jgi:hypothetical protein